MTARSPWLVLAVVSTALFLIVIDMTVLYTALPTLTRDLNASATEKLWIVNAYSLVVAGLLPGAGALGIAILGSLMAGSYSAGFAANDSGYGAQAMDSLDGAIAIAAGLPADHADYLLSMANAAFNRATGAVAIAAGLALLAAGAWVGHINRAGARSGGALDG